MGKNNRFRGGGGGGKRGRFMRKDFKGGRPNVWRNDEKEDASGEGKGSKGGWNSYDFENAAFDDYYKNQHIVPDDEWDKLIETLKTPLPTTFRINGSGKFAYEIRDQMQREFFDLLKDKIEIDGEVLDPPRTLPWYPNSLAWHMSYSRTQLRKLPILEKVFDFLKRENELGSITRQEAVSMIPPLLLDVKPHHKILDMCAAPGSKTFQLLEMIHAGKDYSTLPEGLVVANDVDVQRCHLLIHQTQRMHSPCIIVTNHPAQLMPSLRAPRRSKEAPAVSLEEESVATQLEFDRVLCDVPCTGDGTLRKAMDIWKKWNTGMANGLHSMQLRIAMRGVAMLKVGGLMVYSTCSLNPIENEAVVSQLLRDCEGAIELVDTSGMLPALKRRPGLKSWKVKDKRNWYSSPSQVDYKQGSNLLPSMFPSGRRNEEERADGTKEVDKSSSEATAMAEGLEAPIQGELEAEVCEFPMERCLRLVPHDMDTGAFFIALLRKVKPLTAKPHMSTREKKRISVEGSKQEESKEDEEDVVKTEETKGTEEIVEAAEEKLDIEVKEDAVEELGGGAGEADEAVAENGENTDKKQEEKKFQRQGRWWGVDPIVQVKDEQLLKGLESYYGILPSFNLRSSTIARSEDVVKAKRLYYVSPGVSEVLRLNYNGGEALKIVSLGIKMFERQTVKEDPSEAGSQSEACACRLTNEGLPVILPHLTRQVLTCTTQDFHTLLTRRSLPLEGFSDQGLVDGLKASNPNGCLVLVLKEETGSADGGSDGSASATKAAVAVWRGRTGVSLLVAKAETSQMLSRLNLTGTEGDHVVTADVASVTEADQFTSDVATGTAEPTT